MKVEALEILAAEFRQLILLVLRLAPSARALKPSVLAKAMIVEL